MPNRLHQLTVAICGAGHSGSTLLGLVLGSHSSMFYAGEAKKTSFIGDVNKPLRKRVCKICGSACAVWSRFEQPPQPDVYEAIARLTDRSVIVDSTKQLDWIEARERELAAVGVSQKLIFLTRDGRAVVNSRRRKYSDEPIDDIIDEWLARIAETEALVARRENDALRVRYESLATEPEAVVREICAFLGLEYEPSMLAYESVEHHPLGGNTGTQSVVARARGVGAGAFAEVPERSADYYGGVRGGFALDLRYRTELSAGAAARFQARAGRVNERYRYTEGDA